LLDLELPMQRCSGSRKKAHAQSQYHRAHLPRPIGTERDYPEAPAAVETREQRHQSADSVAVGGSEQ